MDSSRLGVQNKSACICTCGCNKYVSYPTRRAHLAAKRAVATTAESPDDCPPLQNDSLVAGKKHQRSNSPEDRSEDWEDRRDDAPSPGPLQIENIDSPPQSHSSNPSSRSLQVAEKTRLVIEQRWTNPPTQVVPGVQEDGDGTDDEDEEEEDLEQPRNEDDNGEPLFNDNDDSDRRSENEDQNLSGDDEGPRDDDDDDDDYEEDREADNPDANLSRTDIASIAFWDRISDDLACRLMTTDNSLDESDLSLLRQYALKVEEHLTESTFTKFQFVFPESYHHTLKKTKNRVELLSDFRPKRYSCCVNSCVCFTGPYEGLTECPNCKEPRFSDQNKARKTFDYLPLIPRLRAMSANRQFAEKMRYRANFEHQDGQTTDVFDGSHYRSLLNKIVPSSNDDQPFFFFSDPRDIALGLSTDGFAPFKRRDKTCWPIILFNYNLPPKIRFQKKYCINVGTVPGPKKPWDMDSFLWPLVQELIQLEVGVRTFDAVSQRLFLLHAYLLLIFGDIPAVALLMRMKGANGISPCRVCKIMGVRGNTSNTYYVPLRRNGVPDSDCSLDPSQLPLRSHAELMAQAKEVQGAHNQATSNRLAKQYGIKGVPILSSLSSVSFPESFPFDFMHLIWENLIPNLILFWTASFKNLDHENQGYVIPPESWRQIGVGTAAATASIPSSFGKPLPNIALQQSQMTAEMYSNWTLFVAPILLNERFRQKKYYQHFLKLVELLKICLELEIDDEMLDIIDTGFRTWVEDYEKFYYLYQPRRLSACPLTVHALLHIAWGIRVAGPVWTYWAFPMERHCNTLLPSIRSRRHPYSTIAAFVNAMAQLDQVRLKYNLYSELSFTAPKAELSVNDLISNSYSSYKLSPPRRRESVPMYLRDKIFAALATRFEKPKLTVKTLISLDGPVLHYARIHILFGGDTIVGCDLVRRGEDSRDASFIKYVQMVDKCTHQRNRQPVYVKRSFFGQLKRVLVIDLPSIPPLGLNSSTTVIYAVVQTVKITQKNDFYTYQKTGTVQVVDLNTVQCVVGRVHDRGRWSIVDRTGISRGDDD